MKLMVNQTGIKNKKCKKKIFLVDNSFGPDKTHFHKGQVNSVTLEIQWSLYF